MHQIADWLEKLGLGQYAQRFAENDIDFDILRDLTDQDLKNIGVMSVGHRRKLLRAIADLKGTSAVPVMAAPPVAPRAAVARVSIMYNPQTAPYAGTFLRSIEAAGPICHPVDRDADPGRRNN